MDRFERGNSHGAAAIREYLAMWREDLDTIEREARRIARIDPDDRWSAGPPNLTIAATYGSQARNRSGLAR